MTFDQSTPGRLALAIAATVLIAAAPARSQAPEDKAATSVVTEADGTRTLLQSITVAAPAAQVWIALTTSEGWRSWAAPVAWVDFRLGGVIETSYQPNAAAGSPANIRNLVVAYLPPRMFAIRNIQAPPNTAFDVPTFQSLHTVILVDRLDDARTRVTFAQPGYRSGEPFDTVFKHFSWGNGWTLEQLKRRFDVGPVDWAKRAAEAAARSEKK
jgi:uncharacterized protein YndB with AHSA1/START domain